MPMSSNKMKMKARNLKIEVTPHIRTRMRRIAKTRTKISKSPLSKMRHAMRFMYGEVSTCEGITNSVGVLDDSRGQLGLSGIFGEEAYFA